MADEAQPDDGMTVRERRAQHAKQQARKDAPARLARKAIVPTIIILVLAAIAAGFYFEQKSQGDCPGHWHSTFDVYVQDANGTTERISFRHPAFDLNGQTPFRSHMHQGDNKNQLHFEQGCVPVEEAFGYIDVDLRSTSIKFEGAHAQLDQAGTYRANDTHALRAFVQHMSDRGDRDGSGRITTATLEWREQSLGSVLNDQLEDGERLLILYGTYTDEQVAQFQAALAPVDGYVADVYQA